MSSLTGDGTQTSVAPESQTSRYTDEEQQKAYSWIIFATVLFAMEGVLNAIWGIAAVSRSHVFVGDAHYVFGDLKTWGWIMIAFAALQGLAALSIMRGGQFGRFFGIAVASLAIIATMESIQAEPFWGLALIAIYVVVIYALAVYGGKPELTQ